VNNRSNPVSESVSTRILCLPLYFDLTGEEIDFVSRLIKRAQNN
jgi:dTDP-4-amino-4,6-dideoxygalactose transaminase